MAQYLNDKKLWFDHNLINTEGVHFASKNYTPHGTYNSTGLFRELGGIEMSLSYNIIIILTKFNFKARSASTHRAPAEWKCYGSNDRLIFTEMTQASQLLRLSHSKTFINSMLFHILVLHLTN